jgi:acetylornithine/succinyldiaminopimelate/putrescine aminotransferase
MPSEHTSSPVELAEPYLRELLSTFGLDVEYVRSVGDTLFMSGADGTEIPVLDCTGGYGSLILGHNHPELVAHARALLAGQTPVHAQFSRRTEATDTAAKLNAIIQREHGDNEKYLVIFGNSGAEAIEAATKHAELNRVMKVMAMGAAIESNVVKAGTAVAAGEAVVAESAYAAAGITDGTFDSLVAAVVAHNQARAAAPPLFLALEGSFHGKLMGSVQLTHNAAFRAPFQGLATQARFAPLDQPEALKRIVEDERASMLDLVVEDGQVLVVERDFPVFCAFLVEPIQGEGGINVVSAEFAAAIQQTAESIGCPVIVDEIQSGMGRTGTFLAATQIGLRGDYYALAKSLGGGLAKVSAMLVRQAHYRKEFELLHSSTFAKDSFSCSIAGKVLDLLEAGGGRAYQQAAERGKALQDALTRVWTEFPDVVKNVRGKGLFLGIEFADQSGAASAFIRDRFLSGTLGYVIAGYLLWEHGIRIAPTGSALHTLRLEPSVNLTDAEIGKIESALHEVCTILRNQDALHLIHPLTDRGIAKPRTEIRSFAATVPAPRPEPAPKAAYIGVFPTAGALRSFDPSLADLSDSALESYFARVQPAKTMAPLRPVQVDGVDLVVYPLMTTTKLLIEALTTGDMAGIGMDIYTRVQAARADGCTVIGFDEPLPPIINAVFGGTPPTGVQFTTGTETVAPGGVAAPPGFGDELTPGMAEAVRLAT